MTKKRSKCLFIMFAIILSLCLVACFVNFTIPFAINGNYYSYSNFVSNLKLGEDVGNGIRFVYRAETENTKNYSELKLATMKSLKEIVQAEGYSDVTVTEYGEDGIVLNVGNLLTEADYTKVENLVGSPAAISFSMSDKAEEAFVRANGIKAVEAFEFYDQTSAKTIFYVKVDFKDKDFVAEATKDGGTLYVFFGDQLFTQMDLSTSDGSKGIPDGYIMIQSEDFTTINIAENYANKIKTGMLSTELTCLSIAKTTATYGNNVWLFVGIAMLVFVVAAFVMLIVKYKHMGYLSMFNLLFFITIGLFLLQSIPLAHFNMAGLLGMIIALIVSIDGLMTIFEKTRQYYQNDTKLYVAFKVAQKESLVKIIIQNVLLIIVGLICVFVPTLSLQSFGWAMLVLPFVSLFTNLVLMRLFIKMYLALNSTDGKKCNFHKGGNNVK